MNPQVLNTSDELASTLFCAIQSALNFTGPDQVSQWTDNDKATCEEVYTYTSTDNDPAPTGSVWTLYIDYPSAEALLECVAGPF